VLLDGRPVELADSYYPSSIARGTRLADQRKVPGGAVTFLAELGHRPAHVEEVVTARQASEQERHLLQLPEHECVLVLSRLSKASDGTPVEFIEMAMIAEGRYLRYHLSL
jgi:DNA-binding GntR family transcriptional regulator